MIAAADPQSDAYFELTDIDGVGYSMAEDLIQFFQPQNNMQALNDLAGQIIIERFKGSVGLNSPISGKTIVFTGTLESVTRGEAKVKAESLGAKVVGSVSKKTDFIIVGADAGTKAKKAAELGVAILSESEWLGLLGD